MTVLPTPRAIALVLGSGAALAGLLVFAPALWSLAFAVMGIVLALLLVDSIGGRRCAVSGVSDPGLPQVSYVGRSDQVDPVFSFASDTRPADLRWTAAVEGASDAFRLDGVQWFENGQHSRSMSDILRANGRGQMTIPYLAVAWKGPMGLIECRKRFALKKNIPALPDIKTAEREAVRLFSRSRSLGETQLDLVGDGGEFDALVEYRSGMDPRRIDWKQSARHLTLAAKEYRAENNNHVALCFDTGRLMTERLGGLSRLDRAVNAALLLGYTSLRSGDYVSLHGFDTAHRLRTPEFLGVQQFSRFQRALSRLEPSSVDANHTLGLTSINQALSRRSLIILFTDFVDTISAELMVEALQRLKRKHEVLFATFRDPILRDLINTQASTSEDATRALIADGFRAERDLVFRRLRTLGIQLVDAPAETFGGQVVNRYLDLKRRGNL